MTDKDEKQLQLEGQFPASETSLIAQQQIDKDIKDRHSNFRKCCKEIFEDLGTVEEYEEQMKKEKQQKKKKEKELAKEKSGNHNTTAVEEEEEEEEKDDKEADKKENIQNLEKDEKNNEETIPIEKKKHAEGVEEDVPTDDEQADEEEEETVTVDCDLLFIMDCTGSMSSYINMCRTQLFLIVEQVKKQFEKSILKIGFVGYRDFGDSKQFEVYPFTTEYDKLKSFINSLQATGGNDVAEDVAGAFEEVLKMGWSCEAKSAILITDAYPHGKRYAKNNSGDRYPDGDPYGRVPENQIVQMIKKGIAFYGLDISATSNLMYAIFNQAILRQTGKNMDHLSMTNAQNQNNGVAGPLGQGGIRELPAFAKAISTSVTNTITQTITGKTLKKQKDVFNSKIMQIINNNRKFGTHFSKTNVSSKTEEDELEEQNKFRTREELLYDQDYDSQQLGYKQISDLQGSQESIFNEHSEPSYSDEDEEKVEDVDEDELRRQHEFEMKNKPALHHYAEIQKNPSQYSKENNSSNQQVRSTFMDNQKVAALQPHQITRMPQQIRNDSIELVADIIHEEEEDEDKEENDDYRQVWKRKQRKMNQSSSDASFSDQILYQIITDGGLKQQQNYIEKIHSEESHKEVENEIIFEKQIKEKHIRAGDEDTKDRKVDSYITKISEEKDKKEFQSICYSFHIDDSKAIDWEEPQLVQNQIKTTLTVNKEKFSEGAMREAFLASDKDLDIALVAKLHKEAGINCKYNFLKNELTGLILAQFFLTEFNQRILFAMDEADLPPQILRFVDCYIYEVRDEDISKNSYFYSVENLMKGDFQKYNNNAGYVIEGDMRKESQLCQAFSHFTWQYSQGHCMVVDLQGTEDGQLTDPQIHTLKNTQKFGKGDLGYEGILRFFRTHHCTSFCKGLALIHPKHHRDIKDNYQFEDFHARQKQQIEKQKELREKFQYKEVCPSSADDYEYQEEEEEIEEKKVEEEEIVEDKEEVKPKVIDTASKEIEISSQIVKMTEIKPTEKEQMEEFKDALIFGEDVDEAIKSLDTEEKKKNSEKVIDEEPLLDIEGFFCLEIDSKIINAYKPPDATKIARVLHKTRSKSSKVCTGENFEHKKNCTRLICSLCKKVGEYNTKELLGSNQKLNKLICAACQQLCNISDKMTFDCAVCKNQFEVSSYFLKMKRLDKATRCENCSLF